MENGEWQKLPAPHIVRWSRFNPAGISFSACLAANCSSILAIACSLFVHGGKTKTRTAAVRTYSPYGKHKTAVSLSHPSFSETVRQRWRRRRLPELTHTCILRAARRPPAAGLISWVGPRRRRSVGPADRLQRLGGGQRAEKPVGRGGESNCERFTYIPTLLRSELHSA